MGVMGRVRRWLLIGVVGLCGLPGVAWAESDVDILLNKLVEKGVLNGVEAGQIRREISESKDTRNAQLAKDLVPESARNWKWKGDLRLRDEMLNQVGTGNDRHRQRIRFRYGTEAKVSDQLKVNFRIATGTATDPVSTNQTFNTFFLKKAIFLDLANAEYTPEVPGLSKVSLIGGMMESPLWAVSPMVWDPDLSWDGAALKLSKELGPTTLFANQGVFSLDSDESEPAALWVIQGGSAYLPLANSQEDILKNLKLTGALAYHDYVNVSTSAKAGTDPLTRESDNTSRATDFNQLNPSIELASQVAGYPLSVFGDWVHNTSAPSSDNDGWTVGLKVGKAKNPFLTFSDGLNLKDGWEGGYFFERLERNAAFDEFVDSDFGGGGTNRRGNVWWVTLATLKNSTLGMKYFASKNLKWDSVTAPKGGENRMQVDWVTKF